MQERTAEDPFPNVCQVCIAGKLHGLDPAHRRAKVGIDLPHPDVAIHPQTHEVIVTFLTPQTGYVILEPFYPS